MLTNNQSSKQVNKQSLIQKLRPPYPLWSVDTPVAGQYKNINSEDVRIKSVSDGSNKRKLSLKMKERNTSYKKVTTMKNNEKFPTITANTQQSGAKSECKSYNIENVGTMCACDESQYLETIQESYYRRWK